MFTVGIAPVCTIISTNCTLPTAVQSDGTTRADKMRFQILTDSRANLHRIGQEFWQSRTNFRFLFKKPKYRGRGETSVDATSPSSKYTSRAPNARPTGDAKTPLAPLLKSYRTSSLTARARALSISAVYGANSPNRGQRFFEAAFFLGFPAKKPDAWRVARRARADHRATPRGRNRRCSFQTCDRHRPSPIRRPPERRGDRQEVRLYGSRANALARRRAGERSPLPET